MNRSLHKGFSLIVSVFLIAFIVSIYIYRLMDTEGMKDNIRTKSLKSINEAKQALIAWAIVRGSPGVGGIPGQFPCPEDYSLIGTSNEGSAMTSCALPSVGRLPWKTLNVGRLLDGQGEPLWYVLSSGFRTAPINSSTPGQLTVNGSPNAAIAIVFSSGKSLLGQSRPDVDALNPPLVSNYLDLTNNDNDNTYVIQQESGNFNDIGIAIKQTELTSLLNKKMLREIRGDSSQGLIKFFNDNSVYPYADIDNNGYSDSGEFTGNPSYQGNSGSEVDHLFFNSGLKTILINNNWMPLISYRVNPSRQEASLGAGLEVLTVTP